MLENLNYQLFYLINATPASPEWMIDLATFLAKDLISIVPVLAAILWLWGPRSQVTAQRQLVIKVAMTLGVSVLVSYVLGLAFPHDRPFVEHVGYTFLHHAPDDSFPSDHGTVIFAFALAFHCLVSRVSGRTLAAGYGWRLPGGADRLRQRGDPVEPLRAGAVSRTLVSLSHPFRYPDPQRLDT